MNFPLLIIHIACSWRPLNLLINAPTLKKHRNQHVNRHGDDCQRTDCIKCCAHFVDLFGGVGDRMCKTGGYKTKHHDIRQDSWRPGCNKYPSTCQKRRYVLQIIAIQPPRAIDVIVWFQLLGCRGEFNLCPGHLPP